MRGPGRQIGWAIAAAERAFDAWRYGRNQHERLRRARVQPYRAYGSSRRVRVLARVLEDSPPERASRDDRWWKNLVATMKRLESDEVPRARVRVRLHGCADLELESDHEGHVEAWLEPGPPAPSPEVWRRLRFELLLEDGRVGAEATGDVLVPAASARYGVVSDLDDTVIQTGATDMPRVVHGTLFGNAYTRLPFPGVAAFYRALHEGAGGAERNPMFYVSSSPWNLYDVLDEALRLHAIPEGPLLLRNWGISRDELLPTKHREHKLDAIEEIFGTYPDLQFLLIGDSGQEDPEIYHEIVHRHPSRVLAVYIRNVSPDPSREQAIGGLAEEVLAAGSALVLTDDTAAAARHAAEHGWIDAARVPEIEREAAVEAPDAAATPTVVVEGES